MTPGPPIELPPQVIDYVRSIFAECNARVSGKMSRMPTTHETSLDLTLIESISQFAAPQRIASDWVVRLDTHYLGGGRHIDEWEIADIGFIVVVRREGAVRLRKIALLQSKRLYPDEQALDEDKAIDYLIGFGRLMEGDDDELGAMRDRQFGFREGSHYRALQVGDDQYVAIRKYEDSYGIPVHYLLYHPLIMPWAQVIPVREEPRPMPDCQVGARVLLARDLRTAMDDQGGGSSPTFAQLGALQHWRLEGFVADELLRCRQGYRAAGPNDPGLSRVFGLRTGPIAAAISITIDQA